MARRTAATRRTWALRAAAAIAVGLVVGFGVGATAVRVLQPPVLPPADTTAAVDNPRRTHPALSATASEVDTLPPTDPPVRPAGTAVPSLVGLEEGDARTAITNAGFTVGTVLFTSSSAKAGTVLSSFPVPGESVPLPATVNLVLSDGRPRVDTLLGQPKRPPAPPSPDNTR